MKSSVFDWNKIEMVKTEKGGLRNFFDTRTETLEQLEVHVTTLNPGITSHVPHQHPNEEMIIVKEGVVEELVSSEFKSRGRFNNLPGAKPAAHHQERRRHSGHLLRDQVGFPGHAGEQS